MYQLVSMEEKIRIPPTLTKMEVSDAILHVLKEKYEGKVNKDFGLILKIVNAKPIGSGLIILGDPNIYYKTHFDLLVFNAEVNEVFLAYVKSVMDFGAFVVIGPFEALLHISQISKDRFYYDKKTKTLISKDGKKKIKEGDKLFVKVSTANLSDISNVKISVTMRDSGLGNIQWLEGKKK